MLNETTYIERKKQKAEVLDFENLVKKGIRMLQELSGKVWTDYNLHDPGVTILEQLCYALTELIYISGFDVKDILTDENGEIPYRELALYKPLEIFPSSTITPNDYRKSIFDHVKEIRNIWLLPQETAEYKGLYRFLIDIEKKCAGEEQEIIDNLKKYYHAHRNLCEDIEKVEIFTREPVEVSAVIEVNHNQAPESILAEIWFRCYKILSPCIVFHSYKELQASHLTLDEILTGPQLQHGYIYNHDLRPPRSAIFVSELMKEVFLIDGVKSIQDFCIIKDGAENHTVLNFESPLKGAYIQLPESAKALKIKLGKENRACTIDISKALRKYHRLVNKYKSTQNTLQELEDLYTLPKGSHINLGPFYSVQNHFPATYGINHFGVPASADKTRKAKTRQLKGYLLLFEQLMVNFTAQFENLPGLFSIAPHLKATYFTKPHTSVPNIAGLIPEEWISSLKAHQGTLENGMKKFDNFYERRNRILDYLLSIYGERFGQKTYRQFNYYHTAEELPQILCENKIFYLKYLVEINRYKASSFNYLAPFSENGNLPQIKLKVSMLLGIRNFDQFIYSDVLANHNFLLVHKKMVPDYNSYLFKRKDMNLELDDEHIANHFGDISPWPAIKDLSEEAIAEMAKEVDYLKDGMLCDEFFRYGINLSLYKIGKLNRRNAYTVVFKHPKYNKHIYIGDFNNYEQAKRGINSLQQMLIHLNQHSEGMHIVEHLLLRGTPTGFQTGCHLINHRGETVFTTTPQYFKNHTNSYAKELSEILNRLYNYLVKKCDNGKFKLYICDTHHAKILKSIDQFDSLYDAELAAEAFHIYFQDMIQQDKFRHNILPFTAPNVPDDFFSCRISVILPSWSARFNNVRFRKYVEETFALNLPAHIYPQFFWVDIQNLGKFEKTYRKWLDAKQSENPEETQRYAQEIIQFLLEHQPEGEG